MLNSVEKGCRFGIPFFMIRLFCKYMALLTKQRLKEDGLTATYAATTAAGDTFDNTGEEILHVKNGHTAAQSITVETIKDFNFGGSYYGKLTKPDVVLSVPAGGNVFIGPFPKGGFDSVVNLTYSGVTALTIAVLRK